MSSVIFLNVGRLFSGQILHMHNLILTINKKKSTFSVYFIYIILLFSLFQRFLKFVLMVHFHSFVLHFLFYEIFDYK
jgi:hypothetical protein